MMCRFLILFLFFSFSLAGQEKDFDFGIVVGANFSTISSNEDVFINRTDVSAGIAVFNPLSEIMAVQLELRYSSQGAKSDSGDTKLRIDNIIIPLLADIRLTDDRLSFQLGPQMGINVYSRSINPDLRADITNIQSFQLSGLGGFQFKSEDGIAVQLRYALGLTDIFTEEQKAKNNVVSLTLGYFF